MERWFLKNNISWIKSFLRDTLQFRAYSLINGPKCCGALSLGEEQELEEREGEVENGGEEYRASEFSEKTVEMATSTMPWHISG